MINSIISEANVQGMPDARYPMDSQALSKIDCAPDEEKQECAKFPYRRIVGQLMYCIQW